MATKILCIIGPTASGKSARAVTEALARNGEIISVDSRQVYRGLDIGTEKITEAEKRGVPHHLIDIRDPQDTYSAGDFVTDASKLIEEITARGMLPILVGGTHFYFDALIRGLPKTVPANQKLRGELEKLSDDELYDCVSTQDEERAAQLDPKNRRRLIRAIEIIDALGKVPTRDQTSAYEVEWIIIDLKNEELRKKIDLRLSKAFERGLIEEVRHVRTEVGDARLSELGLEYRIVGEYLRKERTENSLFPALSAKLWQYARHQKAWLRKLQKENIRAAVA